MFYKLLSAVGFVIGGALSTLAAQAILSYVDRPHSLLSEVQFIEVLLPLDRDDLRTVDTNLGVRIDTAEELLSSVDMPVRAKSVLSDTLNSAKGMVDVNLQRTKSDKAKCVIRVAIKNEGKRTATNVTVKVPRALGYVELTDVGSLPYGAKVVELSEPLMATLGPAEQRRIAVLSEEGCPTKYGAATWLNVFSLETKSTLRFEGTLGTFEDLVLGNLFLFSALALSGILFWIILFVLLFAVSSQEEVQQAVPSAVALKKVTRSTKQ